MIDKIEDRPRFGPNGPDDWTRGVMFGCAGGLAIAIAINAVVAAIFTLAWCFS